MAIACYNLLREFRRSLLSVAGMPSLHESSSAESAFNRLSTQGGTTWDVKSGPSTTPALVTFKNATDSDIQCFWIDYDGREVAYEVIAPGKEYRQRTFVQHPWTFKSAASKEQLVVQRRMVVFPDDKPVSEMIVSKPLALEWSPTEHQRFPEQFKRMTRDLLLWHARLYQHTSQVETPRKPQRQQGPADILCGLPPELLVCVIGRAAPRTLDIVS